MKKCFVKAGFPAQVSPDTQDIAVQNLKEIVDLCMQGKMSFEAEDVVNFDDGLATTEDIQSAADIASKNTEELDDGKCEERDLRLLKMFRNSWNCSRTRRTLYSVPF